MTRRGFGLGIALSLLVAIAASALAIAAPTGPRLAIVKLQASERTEMFTSDALGGSRSVLYASSVRELPAVYPFSAPSWSPDGTRLAFTVLTGRPNALFLGGSRTMLALIGADGGSVEVIPGTAGGYAPVFSPDGHSIAFAKDRKRTRPNGQGAVDSAYESTSIWLVDLAGGERRQLTPWRDRLQQVPSSFSPDGSRLAFTRVSGDKPPEALAMEFNGSADSVLARNALEPVYSPDGSQIAFLRGPVERQVRRGKDRDGSTVSVSVRARLTDIYIRSSSGGELRRITRTDDAAELTPSWDPSGQRLAYTRWKPFGPGSALLGFGDAVMEVNADGTCATQILSRRTSIHFAATWQPGPDRGAGPISC